MPCLVASFKHPRKSKSIKAKDYFCYPIAVFDFNFTEKLNTLYWNCKCLEFRDVCLFNKDILQRIKNDIAITEKNTACELLKEKLHDCIYSVSKWYNNVDLDYFATRYEYPEIIKNRSIEEAA